MSPLLRYLISIGLRADATMSDAWAFASKVTDPSQRSEIRRIIDSATDLTPPESFRSVLQGWQSAGTTETPSSERRTDPPNNPPETPPATLATDEAIRTLVDAHLQAAQAQQLEVTRMFRENGVENDALLARALQERWTPARTAQEILPLVRQRSEPLDATGHVGIHVRGQASPESLGLAIMLRNGTVPLDYAGFTDDRSRNLAPEILRRDINDDQRQRAMEEAHRLNSGFHHWLDVCRHALIVTGQKVPHDAEEMVRAAFSNATVQNIFTSDVNARVLKSYLDAGDTTMGWTRTEERSDFKINEGITMGKFGALKVHGPGKTADHLDVGTEKYQYRMFRYSGQFTVDEMDMINDRFGALAEFSPEDIGFSAAQLRPNLVYSRLLANATFNGTALFHASRGNLFSGAGDALSITSVEAAETAMSDQRISGRPLNLPLNYLLLPRQLKWKAKQLLESTERRGTGADFGTANTLRGEGIDWVADSRLGTAGCIDPETGTAYTGTATNWYATSSPGVNGAKTMVVCYRTGTNRAPKIRKYLLDKGQWGIGWDINLDIGCGVEDYRAMQRHAGA